MKLATIISSPPIRQALELVLTTFDHTITALDEADVVICSDVDRLLPLLREGRTVVQFVTWNERPARELRDDPEFAGRFFIFGIVSPEFPEVPALLAFLAERDWEQSNPPSLR